MTRTQMPPFAHTRCQPDCQPDGQFGDPATADYLTTCQCDAGIIGGPREHSGAVAMLHCVSGDNLHCWQHPVCLTHLPFDIAFQLQEAIEDTTELAISLPGVVDALPNPLPVWRSY